MSHPETMTAIVRTSSGERSSAGALLDIVERPVPEPGKGEVLVQMEASTCNPSDLASIVGGYSVNMQPGQICGFEGCGRVVSANAGLLGRFLTGRRVACAKQEGDGLWAQYAVLPANACVPVGDRFPAQSASAFVVNPFTSFTLVEMARKSSVKAIVQTAGNSQVGRGVIALCRHYGLKSISIVRRQAQMAELEALGSDCVLDQSAEDFDAALADAMQLYSPGLFFDAVGGDVSVAVLSAAPDFTRMVVYGFLDPDESSGGAFSIRSLIFKQQTISGFWLAPHLQQKPIWKLLFMANKIKGLFDKGVLNTKVASRSSFEAFPAAIDAYVAEMSAGKPMLEISPSGGR